MLHISSLKFNRIKLICISIWANMGPFVCEVPERQIRLTYVNLCGRYEKSYREVHFPKTDR